MLVLGVDDSLRGDAGTASKVDYSFHGYAGTAISFFAEGQLPDSDGELFAATAITVIKAMVLVNTDTSAIAINLTILKSGQTARRLIPKDLSLGIGHSLYFDGAKFSVIDASGNLLTSIGLHAASHTDGTDDIQNAEAGQKGLATAAQITKLDAIEALADVTATNETSHATVLVDADIGGSVQAHDAKTAKYDEAQAWEDDQNFQDNILQRAMFKDCGILTSALGGLGGGAVNIDIENGNCVSATIDTAETTLTFINSTAADDMCIFALFLTNGGSQTVNFTNVDWGDEGAPDLTASGLDILIFATIGGITTWKGRPFSLDC